MNFIEINNILRKGAQEHPGISRILNLPNTVILGFRKDESKTLSLVTFTKFISGLGYELNFEIKDANGNVVGEKEILEKIAEVTGASSHKKTLATIAGVTSGKEAKKDEETEMPSIEVPGVEEAEALGAEAKEDSNKAEAPGAEAEDSKEDKQVVPEVNIDLDEMFG